jgi:hypothetical protein
VGIDNAQPYLKKRFSRSPDFVSRKIAGELIIVPIRRSASEIDCIYAGNEVAARIWELIDAKREVSAIRDAVVEEFEVELDIAETDLVGFLQQLEEVGAVMEA